MTNFGIRKGVPEAALSSPLPIQALPLSWRDPLAVFHRFAENPYLAWLDSQASRRARYSILGPCPYAVLAPASHAARLAVSGGSAAAFPPPVIVPTHNPFPALRQFQGEQAQSPVTNGNPAPLPLYRGGAIGFLGYECGAFLERTPRHPYPGPDFFIGLHDLLLVWDHTAKTLTLISTGQPEQEPESRLRRAQARADALLAALPTAATPAPPPLAPALAFTPTITPSEQKHRIAAAIRFIEAGDIFQANITMAFRATPAAPSHPAALYAQLRAQNPAPFGAFLACGPDFALASVSPERFLTLSAAGDIEARPIKGTRKRGTNPEDDAAQATILQASAKDRAENLMIADLLRNDIGRVAEIGSIQVPELAVLETFPKIHHLVSSIRGRLRAGRTATDLLAAAFPGGSITGAPKIRAIEIIHALEKAPRGPYCGALFWLGADGAMDASILIRTAVVTPRAVTIQAGGGITADSDPDQEYEECLLKAAPLLRALG